MKKWSETILKKNFPEAYAALIEKEVVRRGARLARAKKYNREYYSMPRNRERIKEHNRWARKSREYGLSKKRYEEMLKSQNGVCAICGGTDSGRDLAVDHDHDTGEVRGLLCGLCNRGLGVFERKREAFENYLRKFKRSTKRGK